MLSKTILEAIRKDYDAGKKQTEIAKDHNVAQQIISRLLSGKRSASGLTVETIEKMFPNATINLNGDKVEVRNNRGTAFGIVHGNVTGPFESGIPGDVLKAIMADQKMSVTEKAQLVKELLKK